MKYVSIVVAATVIGLIGIILYIRRNSSPKANLPDMQLFEIDKAAEDGFADLTLSLTSKKSVKGIQTLTAEGLYQGEKVGFHVVLNLKDGEEILIRSMGGASNRFVSALNDLYEMRSGSFKMRSEIQFVYFLLDDAANRLKIKLFHDDGNDENYAECYLNIYYDEHRVELLEKDPGYRTALLKALAQ